jgi:hypothetical protein
LTELRGEAARFFADFQKNFDAKPGFIKKRRLAKRGELRPLRIPSKLMTSGRSLSATVPSCYYEKPYFAENFGLRCLRAL